MPTLLIKKESGREGYGIKKGGRGRELTKSGGTRWQEVISFWLFARVMERVS